MQHSSESQSSVPDGNGLISLKNLLHDLQCAKEAAARILTREHPELIKEWHEKTEYLKVNTERW